MNQKHTTDINGRVTKTKRPSSFITTAQRDIILNKLKDTSEVAYLFVSISFKTGLRLNEIPDYIKESHNKEVGQNTEIFPLKRSNKRIIPVCQEAITAYKYVDYQPKTIQRYIHRLFGSDFSIHDCRHTFATNMANMLRDPYRLCALMGWRSVAMADRYVRLNPDNLTHFYKFGTEENAFDVNIDYYELYLKERNENERLRKLLGGKNV